jgi:acetyl-CoA carboxylase biotin carboxyl carrier protein
MSRRSSQSGDQPAGAVQIIGGLADEVVPSLIKRLNASGLGEIEIRNGGWRVRLRRPLPADGDGSASPPIPASRLQPAAGSSAHRHEQRESDGTRPAERDGELLTAPAVGYFVGREGITPGASVRAGDTVGYIEVLGVREEVVTPIDGAIDRFEVEAGQAVEYGQPIARLKPAAGSADR